MTETTNLTERPEDTLRRYAGILVKIREIHQPMRIYEECGHAHAYDSDAGRDGAGIINYEDFVTCEDGYLYDICRWCCADLWGSQVEACADYHQHGEGKPICPTAAALDERETEAAT